MSLTILYTIIVILVIIIIYFIGFRDKKYSLIDMFKKYRCKDEIPTNTI